MKKFSNYDKKEEYTKKYPSQLRKTIGRLIEEKIVIQYDNEPSNLTLKGKEELIDKIENYIKEHTKNTSDLLLESTIHSSIHMYSLPVLNNMVNTLYDELDSLNMIPEPKEVFSYEDYVIKESTIQLNDLKNIPEDYFLEYLSEKDIKNFFVSESKILITKLDEGWNVNYLPSTEYINEDKQIDYKLFVKENNDFLADFSRSCESLVGKGKIRIENIDKMI